MDKHLVAGHMAENLIGSEIIKLAWEINARIKEGQKIFNLTIGDYNSEIFPIPGMLTEEIKKVMKCEPESYKNSTNALETRNIIKPENNKPDLI